jgi:hypothetical protein
MSKNKWGLFKVLPEVQHFEKDKIKVQRWT